MRKLLKNPLTPIALFALIILAILFFPGQSDIKNNFCGIHIDYRYCKCAFHNEYCESLGMSKSEANSFVQEEYEKWKSSLNPTESEEEDEKYGIIEKDGNLYLNSKPGEVLEIKTKDLPNWAREKIATVGAEIMVGGPLDQIAEGDSNVLLDGLPIARVGDETVQGGVITVGSENIFVNGKPVAIIGGMTTNSQLTGTVPHIGGPIINNVN